MPEDAHRRVLTGKCSPEAAGHRRINMVESVLWSPLGSQTQTQRGGRASGAGGQGWGLSVSRGQSFSLGG